MKLSEELGKWRIDRPDEWKMDEFMRNAEKLESERDTAMAQNLEQLNNCLAALQIANKRIDKLEKYNLDLANESHNKSNMIDYERSKNAELVAQVANLTGVMQSMADSHLEDGETEAAEQFLIHINKTPAQHLRDRDAEAGRAGFLEGSNRVYKSVENAELAANQYAEKVRRGEV